MSPGIVEKLRADLTFAAMAARISLTNPRPAINTRQELFCGKSPKGSRSTRAYIEAGYKAATRVVADSEASPVPAKCTWRSARPGRNCARINRNGFARMKRRNAKAVAA